MDPRGRLRTRSAIACALLAGALLWPALGRAGTTGGIGGHVADAGTQAPLAGVAVRMSSPSGGASTLTDARGHYALLSLPPDTYSITATRDGYEPFTELGITIQADVQLNFDITLQPAVKSLGRVVTTAGSGLVRPGQTINVYSIYPSTAAAARALAGPGGVDQAYSALAAVPGIYVPQGQQGWYQPIYIRGGDQDQIGYELDGVPVNRSYDNAPESLLTSVGQQELQVYTGGANASSDGQGISGYINQVIKTGSRVPFGSLTYGFGFPAGYQKGAFEYGGASPDGRLSYYISAALANQYYRYVDQNNGASLYQNGFFFPSFQFTPSFAPIDLPGITLGASQTRDRESVINLHYGIPHPHDGGSDDVQLLHMESDLHTFTYGSLGDFGGASTFGATFLYPDQYIYTGPVDALLDTRLVGQYVFPNTPDANRAFMSPVSLDRRAVADNNFALTKLQYQHNIGSRAYLRLLGFNTYSLWDIEDPIPVPSTLQFILPEITFGGVLSFADQLNDRNLLTISGSLASSREYRYTTGFNFLLGGNNFGNGTIGGNFTGAVNIGSYTDGTHCYDQSSGGYTSCFASASQAFLNVNAGTFDPFTTAGAGTPAALNGARWVATENGLGGLLNQVSPILSAGSISDRIRPTDALTVDAGVRVERYLDRLVNEAAGYPARQFWFNAFNHEFCFAPATLGFDQRTIDPATGAASPCPAGSNPAHVQLSNDPNESNSVVEPRVAATYQFSPDSTLRASYGTYARPPNASWVQYGTLQQNLAVPMAEKFLRYGFTSPQHDLVPDISHNVDLSWEQRVRGSDLSWRVTPYYRGTIGQFENILLDTSGNESGVNVGSEKSYGVELALQKGDFARDGIAAVLAATYDHSRFTYSKFASGFNLLDLLNVNIQTYNAYTSACATGGSAAGKTQFGSPLCGSTTSGVAAARCFTSGGAPDPTCSTSGNYPNPYWNKPAQPLFDPGAAYAPYDVLPDEPLSAGNGFGPPVTATLLVQYKHSRFTATPSVTFTSGASYGAPLAMEGGDPAQCLGTIPNCFTTIPIPDDFTGRFDGMGAFMQPSRLTGNISFGYAVAPGAQLSLEVANIFDVCHQRGYAWDRPNFCVYTTLPFSVQPNSSTLANAPGDLNYKYPYTVQNGNNNTQFLGTKIPLQAYVSLQVKL